MKTKCISKVNLDSTIIRPDALTLLDSNEILFGSYLYNEISKERYGNFGKLSIDGLFFLNPTVTSYLPVDFGVLDMESFRKETSEHQHVFFSSSKPTVGILKHQVESENPISVSTLSPPLTKKSEFSLAMAPAINPWDSNNQVVGLSCGNVSQTEIAGGKLREVRSISLHESEIWTTCFTTPATVACGADDGTVSILDLRDKDIPIKRMGKHHLYGVTSIIKLNDLFFMTGSYDETVAIWDIRNIKTPLTTILLNGGIWRIKKTKKENTFVCSLSHDGAEVIKLEDVEVTKMATYNSIGTEEPFPHKSMIYDSISISEDVFVSCSFYDSLFSTWSISN
eukprot:GHVP01036138.1.p1 GENE.GHVP01036138.1~~GHVP01036138.1.p1  ORF type:complete len:345 (-),score=48.22 GHVP01036138.1:729-1742(-)